eukprot:625019-Amphidinium_carterae.1
MFGIHVNERKDDGNAEMQALAQKSIAEICRHTELRPQLDAFLDCNFVTQFMRCPAMKQRKPE